MGDGGLQAVGLELPPAEGSGEEPPLVFEDVLPTEVEPLRLTAY